MYVCMYIHTQTSTLGGRLCCDPVLLHRHKQTDGQPSSCHSAQLPHSPFHRVRIAQNPQDRSLGARLLWMQSLDYVCPSVGKDASRFKVIVSPPLAGPSNVDILFETAGGWPSKNKKKVRIRSVKPV
jgi:hypothetical protein